MVRSPLSVGPLKLEFRYFRKSALVSKFCHSPVTPLAFKLRTAFSFHSLSSPNIMPSPMVSRLPVSPDLSMDPFLSSHSMKVLSPLLFEDNTHFDSDGDQMIFPLEFEKDTLYSTPSSLSWDPFADFDHSPPSDVSTHSGPSPSCIAPFDHNVPLTISSNNYTFQDALSLPGPPETQSILSDHDDNDYLSTWLKEPEFTVVQTSSLPIPIRSHIHDIRPPSSIPFPTQSYCSQDSSPKFSAPQSLPLITSPTKALEDCQPFPSQPFDSISPHDTSFQAPAWVSQLWVNSSYVNTPQSPQLQHSPLLESPRRQRTSIRRDSFSGQMFQSSSAPSALHTRNMTRSYSRRAEPASVSDDRDATVRRKKRIPTHDETRNTEKIGDNTSSKSLLRPPKLAPSAWQLYFTDWIQRQQASSTRKLNVAQAAKEAGQEYAGLSAEEKEPYKRRSQAAKEARERELAAYMRTLTPDDIKRENAFRAAQRKAGKSRKSNIKDPNAPKKPLSAYFMFLQRIRSDSLLVKEVFGDETETTKQSVLAAAKWRSMTDDERKPFLAKAEQEKLDYEAARRLYEEGTVAHGSSINFSILPGSAAETVFRASPEVKLEPGSSESESEGFTTDDGMGTRF